MPITSSRIDTSQAANGDMLVYPKYTPEYTSFVKLTSYKYDSNVYGSFVDSFVRGETDLNALSKVTPTSHIFLPIPTSGLNDKDDIVFDLEAGGLLSSAMKDAGLNSLITEGIKSLFGVEGVEKMTG